MTDIAEAADLRQQLAEAAGRVTALEAERDQATSRAETAEAALAEHQNRAAAATRARAKVLEANGTLDADVVDRIVEAATRTLPVTDDGKLDETALDAAVESARTAEETYLARRGARTIGSPAPDGGSGAADDVAEAATTLAKLDARLDQKIGAR